MLRRRHMQKRDRLSGGQYGEVYVGAFYDVRVDELYNVAIKAVRDVDALAKADSA